LVELDECDRLGGLLGAEIAGVGAVLESAGSWTVADNAEGDKSLLGKPSERQHACRERRTLFPAVLVF